MDRTRVLAPALFVLAATLFLIANRGAYHGYFFEDDFSNLSFTRWAGTSEYLTAAFSPRYYPNNYRPIGHLFFRTMAHAAGLHFQPYIGILHLVHLANVAMVWLLLRRLLLPLWAASAGALFFAFHMATFGIYWMPMYAFDLLCGTFCLLSLLLWLKDRWLLSLLCFWVAYRCKEVAVMLPLALAAYEYLLGKRRWPRLVPFFLVSVWFGIQGLLTASSGAGYKFHYDLPNLGNAALYYSARLFLIPATGLAILPVVLLLPFVVAPVARDRRFWLGVAAFATLLAPMLLLSDKLDGPYLYVPLIGLAIAVAVAAPRQGPIAIVLFFGLWIPWNYANLRWLRRDELSAADDRRRYVTMLGDFLRSQPAIKSFVYRNAPLADPWGAQAAIEWFRPLEDIRVAREDANDARTVLDAPQFAVLHWNRFAHRLEPVVRLPDTPDLFYIEAGAHMPVWQLGAGWAAAKDGSGIRWTKSAASARLARPPAATEFEITAVVNPDYLTRFGPMQLMVTIDGRRLEPATLDQSGRVTAHWKVDAAPPDPARVTVATSPPYRISDETGITIAGFGFTR